MFYGRLCFLLFIIFFVFPSLAEAEEPLKVAYVEGGFYSNYHMLLSGLVRGFGDRGIIESQKIDNQKISSTDTSEIWAYLSNFSTKKITFLKDGHYSAGWDEEKRAQIASEIGERYKKGEIDLVLAFGTWAGQDLVPKGKEGLMVMSFSTTDPVAAGISKSVNYSGNDNVFVMVLERTERQIRLFYELFGFKRLGVPLDKTISGKLSMGYDSLLKISSELGFSLEICESDLELSDAYQSYKNLLACFKDLSSRSDAVYMTVNNGMGIEHLNTLLKPMIEAKIPTFSQNGTTEIKEGVLLSLGQDNFDDMGYFGAEVLEKVLSGETPGRINQIYESPLTLALNLKMALAIGWNPPFEVLVAVDELYQDFAVASDNLEIKSE